MPELPEVETVRRRLAEVLPGQIIDKAVVLNPALRFPIQKNFSSLLKHKTVNAVKRRAKYLVMELDDGLLWMVHLGMSGRFNYRPEGEEPNKYTCFRIFFRSGAQLLFHDIRRFGYTRVGKTIPDLEALGPEPLGKDFTKEYLIEAARKGTRSIKALLLDQGTIAGLGNIYASESLFTAGIHPEKSASALKPGQLEKLVEAIRKVLKTAIADGGSSISDFLDTDGRKGSYQEHFLVYDRAGLPCPKCGSKIKQVKQQGRSSYFCPKCQK